MRRFAVLISPTRSAGAATQRRQRARASELLTPSEQRRASDAGVGNENSRLMSDGAARPGTAAWHVFAAAGVAAAVELSIMQPLDVVKTRLQLQSSQLATADRYSGTWHALRSIHAAEGAAGLWRGFGTGLAIVIPRRGLKFAFNDFFRSVLQPPRGAAERPSFHRNLAAGGLAGACEAVLITPLEVIKVITPPAAASASTPAPAPAPARASASPQT